jgi:hypothetical protein
MVADVGGRAVVGLEEKRLLKRPTTAVVAERIDRPTAVVEIGIVRVENGLVEGLAECGGLPAAPDVERTAGAVMSVSVTCRGAKWQRTSARRSAVGDM